MLFFVKLHKLRESAFFRMNLIFFIGSLIISFLNYLFYPILGRILPIESFGELQVILSIYTQITIFFSVLTLITINIVVNQEEHEKVEVIIEEFEKLALYICLILLVVAIVIAPFLQTAFKFESPLPFIMMVVILISNLPIVFKTAYLRGKSDFYGTSVSGIITSALKILLSAIFVYFGFKTSGAIGGIIAANVINFIYIRTRVKKHGYEKVKSSRRLPDFKLIKPQLPYAILVLVTSLLLTMYGSVDITLVKYLFPKDIAGQYAGISVISNIVLFITGSFSIVILSSVKRSQTSENNNRILFKSFLLTLIIGGSIAFFFSLFPTFIVQLLFGNKYDAFAFLLPQLSISMLLASLSNLIANYHIALRHYAVAIFVIAGALFTAILLLADHSAPGNIVHSLFIGSAIMFGLLFLWTTKSLNFRKIL